MLERALGLLGDVDLAFPQPLDQIVGGDVHQLDGIGTVEDRVRHGLAHADAGDLRHDIVEAFDVLNIDRGVDVDAAVQQLFHIEIAFGVAAARCIGVRKLIDENDLRVPGDDGVEIHLLEASGPYTRCACGARPQDPANSASVSLRPWVSATPTTMS